MQTIFSAGSQGTKVRAIQLMSLVACPVALWAAWLVITAPATRPRDDLPMAARIAVAAFAAVIGLGFLIGMWVYGRCYAREIAVDGERSLMQVTLIGFLVPSRFEVPLDAIVASRDHAGQMHTHEVSVNAPWTSLSLRGRTLPLIVDAQGELHDPDLAERFLFEPSRPARKKKGKRRASDATKQQDGRPR